MLIKEKYEIFKQETNSRFLKIKKNEEELNNLFIGAYELNNEMNPEVQNKNVSCSFVCDSIDFVEDEYKDCKHIITKQMVIKDLLSYAMGCVFGRFSLDVDGVVYAGGVMDWSKYKKYIPDKDNIIPINDDEYFDDDIVNKIVDFVSVVYGKETLNQNLQFIADALGYAGDNPRQVIRNYLLKDFFKDHCQKYSNRPIYWLFDSGKENGFKALVYLHRYEEDTIAKMRAEYLHKVQRVYESEMNRMQETIENSTDNREVAVARKKKEKFTKQLLETKEYDEVLGHVALQRIPLDLDDGVKVNYQKFQNIDYIKNGKSVKKNLLVNIFK